MHFYERRENKGMEKVCKIYQKNLRSCPSVSLKLRGYIEGKLSEKVEEIIIFTIKFFMKMSGRMLLAASNIDISK